MLASSFAPLPQCRTRPESVQLAPLLRVRSKTSLASSPGPINEKTLRQTIASRNEQVDNEGQYAVVDGENLYKGIVLDDKSPTQQQVLLFVDEEQQGTTTVTANVTDTNAAVAGLMKKMQRITRPRAYPLFLAEKAAEIAEMAVHGLLHSNKKQHTYQSSTVSPRGTSSQDWKSATKERVVVLGSGWGAASFLKEIDTDQYDVTVISPRVSRLKVIAFSRGTPIRVHQ